MASATQVSWALSGFGDEIDDDPAVQIAVLQSLGANHIEVRSAWGTNIVDLSDNQLTALATLLKEKGMQVSAIASPIGKVDVSLPVEHEVRAAPRGQRCQGPWCEVHPDLFLLLRRVRSGG